MGRTIVIANQKGGVGKTTTAINLSASLADLGKKILVIDTDPQGNTSSGLGVEKNEVENTVYELLIGETTIEECIQKEVFENLDIISSNINLAAAEIELTGFEEKEFILKKAVDQVRADYDFIIIDCPPSLNTLTINAMCAADTVLVPIQCEYYALEGLSQLMNTVELVRDRLNPNLEIEGVVFTMYDARTNLSLQVVENVKANLDQKIYKTIIPRNVRLAEAPSYGMPITKYDARSTGAESYRLLAEENGVAPALDGRLPHGVTASLRKGSQDIVIVQNYNEKPAAVPLNASYTDLETGNVLSGTLELSKYGVAFLIKAEL